MTISIFDLFSIGIGPSSSHTVGPMRAAKRFVEELNTNGCLTQCQRVKIGLFGSLALTGLGHGTDRAIIQGLRGETPETVDPQLVNEHHQAVLDKKSIKLNNIHTIPFDYEKDLIFHYQETLPFHTNGMTFFAFDQQGACLYQRVFYSVGGGFIVESEIIDQVPQDIHAEQHARAVPYPFHTAKVLLLLCEQHHLSIADLMLANETTFSSETTVKERLLAITEIMLNCITAGCEHTGILPGGLNIPRRAPMLYQKLQQNKQQSKQPITYEQTDSMAWLNLFAIAVNEENAAGGRIVTAPTNGAAGIIPAVLNYYLAFYPQAKKEDAIPFLLTAGAIAILYKKGASISGAEVGCQGEVGVACSMAAGALTALLGGTLYQIENAAEIAMEHHLGLTCDPIHGLVQIPCIERNAMGAVKAVNAARLALLGDGTHYVSLDKVIATMKQTGKDMMSIYKETSLGGLAVNLPEC